MKNPHQSSVKSHTRRTQSGRTRFKQHTRKSKILDKIMIPNLLQKTPIPKFEFLPLDMQEIVRELRDSHSQKEALVRAFEIVTKRFTGKKHNFFLHFPSIFQQDIKQLWTSKHTHCTQSNYILRTLLIHSGWFREDHISQRLMLYFGFSPHQFLEVTLETGESIKMDAWAKEPLDSLPHGIVF